MPGRFFLARDVADVVETTGLLSDLPTQLPRQNIAPGQDIIVGRDVDLTMMRWRIIPVGRKNARGRPVMETIVNIRSETVFEKSAFEGLRRCIVPVDGWYEWTGKTRKKTAWRIAPRDGSVLIFAALYDVWNGPGGTVVPQVATLTCEPNADVRDIHHRMGVLLRPDQITEWLTAETEKAAEMLRPYPDGLLSVTPADDVDWTAG